MTSNQKWPNNWEHHVLQYCNFYFSDKDIKYKDIQCRKDTLFVSLKFQIGDLHYVVSINHNEDHHFSCNIFYKKLLQLPFKPDKLHPLGISDKELMLLDDVAGLGGFSLTVVEIMEFAEQAMWDDYNRRKGNDWDNDDDDGEDSPIKPYSPADVVEPELTLL